MSKPSARLRLRVSPGASRSEVVGRYREGWKVRVAAPAERGRANEALLRLLAEALGVPKSSLRIVRGQRSREKLVAVDGLEAAEVRRRLGLPASNVEL